jgi:hypothetical protein
LGVRDKLFLEHALTLSAVGSVGKFLRMWNLQLCRFFPVYLGEALRGRNYNNQSRQVGVSSVGVMVAIRKHLDICLTFYISLCIEGSVEIP